MKNNFLYFENLANYSRSLLDKLPIEKEVQPLEYAVGKLYSHLKNCKEEEIKEINKIWSCKKTDAPGDCPVGLNTVGLLIDRFTILIIKEWCLRNKKEDTQKADELYRTQTMEIIAALAASKPGHSSINSKITNIKTNTEAFSWEEAYYGMLSINLVLWESQEVLYIKDISKLESEELRAYINWFSKGNMERNVLMELCERRFWERLQL